MENVESHVACHSMETEHDLRQVRELCTRRTSSSHMESLHMWVQIVEKRDNNNNKQINKNKNYATTNTEFDVTQNIMSIAYTTMTTTYTEDA